MTRTRLAPHSVLLFCALTALALAGCGVTDAPPDADGQPPAAPAPIELHWQRLVDATGKTCGRCGATEESLAEAEAQLRTSLAPLGLRLHVRKEAITPAAFAAAPTESNRIFIDGRPIEDLLGATTGKSECCDACGDEECRTLVVDGQTHEAISARLIVRATLIAAAARLGTSGGGGAPVAEPCCAPGTGAGKGASTPCCTPAKESGADPAAPCCAPGTGAGKEGAAPCCDPRPGDAGAPASTRKG